jgi:Arc/MetJ-type ribon-helix-helix transcriptional regulator
MLCELPPDVEQQVKRLMQTGQYATEADLLRDALAALQRRDEEMAAVRAGVDDMEAGRVRPFEATDAEIRKQFGFGHGQ